MEQSNPQSIQTHSNDQKLPHQYSRSSLARGPFLEKNFPMPGELKTSFDFYQRKNEQHQIAGLCAIVREGKLNCEMQAALCRVFRDRKISVQGGGVVQLNHRIIERAQIFFDMIFTEEDSRGSL
jgi:hypothetical protein